MLSLPAFFFVRCERRSKSAAAGVAVQECSTQPLLPHPMRGVSVPPRGRLAAWSSVRSGGRILY